MTTPRRQGQWRWVAHPPWRPPTRVPRPPVPRHRAGAAWATRTPRYPAAPRWGLPMVAVPRRIGSPESPRRRSRLGDSAPGILRVAGAWFLATAIAHGLRYLALAWYADRVAPWWIEAVTSALVWVTGAVALGTGACAAIAATAWLVRARRLAYEPGTDPRSRFGLWLGSLVVVVNIFRLPVYLEELRRASSRAPARSVLLRWWAVWVVNILAVVVAYWRSTGEGSQAAADAVLLTAIAALTGAWAIRETRAVMNALDDPAPRVTRRLIPAAGVATTGGAATAAGVATTGGADTAGERDTAPAAAPQSPVGSAVSAGPTAPGES